MKSSRRSFLEAGLALPAILNTVPTLTATSQPAKISASKDSSFDPWVEIHRENLRHNVQEISRRAGKRPILAVIKNNGYGMGVANVAQLLEPQSEIIGFAVVKFHEAVSLRDAGIRKPVLLMGPFDGRNLEEAAARNIMPMVYTPMGPALDKVAANLQKPVAVHICVDTGIGRVGVPYYQAAPLFHDLRSRKSAQIQGTMMTFAEDMDFDKEQLRRFQETCGALEKEGIALGNRLKSARGVREEAAPGRQRRLQPGVHGQRGSVGGDAASRACGRLAAHGGEGRQGANQRRDVSGDRVGFGEPLHRRNRQGRARKDWRHGDSLRRTAGFPARGCVGSVRGFRV